jgi:very-short-patch-repair endonuclease
LGHVIGGKWCPYCANKKLCDDTTCESCLNKSFALHEKSQQWSKTNGDITPIQVFKSSGKKYWFDCNICFHSFETVLSSITRGQWCSYCSNPPKKLCDDTICEGCSNKSFASHEKSQCWSKKNGDITPRQVFRSSNTRFWFDCDKCIHQFETTLSGITRGQWCPYCYNKTEGKLYEKLKVLYPSVVTQFKQNWCKNITYLPYDFCIPELNIIIELDGLQHFKQVSSWKSPEETFANYKYKEQCANANNYSMIRLLQDDVWFDKYDWCKELCNAIEDIQQQPAGGTVTNKYLCKNGEYDHFDDQCT